MEQEFMETVLRDMLQDLALIKKQNQYLVTLQEGLETQRQVSLSIEERLAGLGTFPATLTDEQLASLKVVVKQEIEALRTELIKLPAINFHHHSVFPVSFRMEHFRMVVNTVMMWFVIFIALFFVMWLVVRFIS